jgi:hypothetical protein
MDASSSRTGPFSAFMFSFNVFTFSKSTFHYFLKPYRCKQLLAVLQFFNKRQVALSELPFVAHCQLVSAVSNGLRMLY